MQVTEGHDGDGEEEVNDYHCHCVLGAGRLDEGAGVDARVVLQGPHEKVGQHGCQGKESDEADVEGSVPAPTDLVVGHAGADVAVVVNGNGSEVEDRANDTQAHHEVTGLAVHLPKAQPSWKMATRVSGYGYKATMRSANARLTKNKLPRADNREQKSARDPTISSL